MRRKIKSGLALASLVGVVSACATVTTTTDLSEVVANKARFELRCEEVEVIEMSGGQKTTNGFAATNQKSYGVEGCGKRASYYAWCTNMMGQESCDAVASNAAPQ